MRELGFSCIRYCFIENSFIKISKGFWEDGEADDCGKGLNLGEARSQRICEPLGHPLPLL